MNIIIALDYDVKKIGYLFEVERNYSKKEVLSILESITTDYVLTDKGLELLNRNNQIVSVHDLMEIWNDIPTEIFEKYKFYHAQSTTTTACAVMEILAFTQLYIKNPIEAIFGTYDEDYGINKYEFNKLLDSVNWCNDYSFRALNKNNRLVGFGFIKTSLLDDPEFVAEDMLNYVADLAHAEGFIDQAVFAYEEIGIKLIRLDI